MMMTHLGPCERYAAVGSIKVSRTLSRNLQHTSALPSHTDPPHEAPNAPICVPGHFSTRGAGGSQASCGERSAAPHGVMPARTGS